MRSLYWKIFIAFWLASTLIIITTAWIISEITRKSSLPAHEKVFMDSYATAAVATFESGQLTALKQWLNQAGTKRNLILFLLVNSGEVISTHAVPPDVQALAREFAKGNLDDGLLKYGSLLISHEIVTPSKNAYRLVALSDQSFFKFIEMPWAGLFIRLSIAIIISGILCYLLSIYLTQPLRSLSMAAKSIAKGQLNTRVGNFIGHGHDEIAQLSNEFDRMAEELENILQSKERLLQDISHELRSPLARLQIAIELGRNKSAHAADKEFSRMEEECRRLNTLIGEILEFARLDKSAYELLLKPVNLEKLLLKIIEDANFEFAKDDKQAQLVTPPCHYEALFDERLLCRALENVLRNALYHTATHTTVLISLEHQDASYCIRIEDQGPGVPEEQLGKIFTPFYRVDTSRTKKTGGYGLGLAIAKKAIDMHQGHIVARNKAHGGLLVEIILGDSSYDNKK